jgi:DeoR family fructose operon transcriptional repressor
MLAEERRHRIVDFLQQRGSAQVPELAGMLRVSEMTIRRDLRQLECLGLLRRTHGGAVANDRLLVETPYRAKRHEHVRQKQAIAGAAVALIKPGESIILDAGSTTYFIAMLLKNRPPDSLTVVTNDICILYELSDCPSLTLIGTGGTVQQGVYSMIGSHAEGFLRTIRADRAFIGAHAIDMEIGLMSPNPEKASIKGLLCTAASNTHLVVDSSKFGMGSLVEVRRLNQFTSVITDDDLAADRREDLERQGVRLVCV